jgi:hypothetical protein
MIVLEGREPFVDAFALDGHKVSQLRIVTAQALVSTHKGDVIATFHQMALLGKGKIFFHAIRWKLMVVTSMISPYHCLVVNKVN